MKAKKYTAAEWREALEWSKGFLGIQDWILTLHRGQPPLGVQPAGDYGTSITVVSEKEAIIYVDVETCNCDGVDPLACLFHEMLHVAFHDLGQHGQGDGWEFLIKRLQRAMLAAYRKGVK